ncbi:MAG: PLP-dependent aminotransferase family protein [Pseudonocardia sp.]|nr:PLP-dependent aminotransferase family protein [Pseudonocardia sp.]
MDVPPIVLDRAGGEPLAAQLAAALRGAAAGGALRAGDRLPSTRALAATLGLSRTVTSAAYEQLLAEGWVEGRVGAGTYVTTAPPASPAPAPARAAAGGSAGGLVMMRAGVPCTEVLDRGAWRRAWRAAADPAPDAEPRPEGLPEFRAAVVEHLLRHRGLPAAPEDVLATGGSTGAIAEIARTLPAGSAVAVEDPGYQRAVGGLRAAGLRVVPVPVDEAGLVVEALPAGLAAVYCTPAHQFPLGGRLPAARRVALVERARADGFVVLEDDYDGELRYDVAPLPLLAALGPDIVAHLGTASKILTPTLGAGWLVAPRALREAVARQRDRTGTRPAPAGQRVFTAFAASGDLARHLRRVRRELAGRRAEVVEALAGIAVRGDEAGAHVVIGLPDVTAERTVLDAAEAAGIALDGLQRHLVTPAPGPAASTAGIVLGYAGSTRAELRAALPAVATILRAALSDAPDAR